MDISLSEIKRERKHMEQDAQLLANRIKLLQLEDEKTWKKIEESKKKAKKLASLKQEQQEMLVLQNQIKQERERALSEKRSNYKTLRESQKKNKEELLSAIFWSKHDDALLFKRQRDLSRRTREYELSSQIEENKIKKITVKRDKQMGKAKIDEFHQKKNSVGREIYWKKIEENERIKKEKIKEVHEMEKLELELIKRLENTQTLHSHITNQIETFSKSPKMNSVYNSLIHKRKFDMN